MREILFRGKRIDNGEWVYGGYAVTENQVYLIYNQAHSIDLQGFTVDENTIGQYTGLTDKNGKKIFEGDILENVSYDGENFRQIDGKLYADEVVYKSRGFVYYEKKVGGFCVRYETEKNGVLDEGELHQEYLGYDMEFGDGGFVEEFDEYYNFEGTVISGNITDNPELLKNPELLEGKP